MRGNHDAHAGDPPADWAITCVDEPSIEQPFAWRHHPAPDAAGYAIGGHLHRPCGSTARAPEHDAALLLLRRRLRRAARLWRVRHGAGAPGCGERVFVVAGQSIIEKSVV